MHLSFPYLGHSVFINSSLFHICISLILNNSFSWNATSQGPPRYSVSAGNAKLKVWRCTVGDGNTTSRERRLDPGSQGILRWWRRNSQRLSNHPFGMYQNSCFDSWDIVIVHINWWFLKHQQYFGPRYEGTKITEKTIRSLEDHTI